MTTTATLTAGKLSGKVIPQVTSEEETTTFPLLKPTAMIADKDTQSRKWQITINNPKEKGFTHDKINETIQANFKSVIYYCLADEIGESGTYHTHIFLCGRSGIRFSTIKKKFEGAHFEMCNGTAQENKEYVSKTGKWKNHEKSETRVEGSFEEYGEMPIERKGRKNNMDDVYSMIKDGYSNFQILEQIPEMMLNMDKVELARQTIIQEKYKESWRDLVVTYIYGMSGLGKTRSVMDKYGYSNVYRVTDYFHPFDSYKGQDVVVFDEFRSSLSLPDMLNYLDGYPLELPCRYVNKYACYTKVFIISNIPLPDQYKNDRYENTHAFYRRIHQVRRFTDIGTQDYKIEFLRDNFRVVLDGEFVPFTAAEGRKNHVH
jgi:hypothetical protein